MARSMLGLTIAGLNTLMYSCLSIFIVYQLIEVSLILNEDNDVDDGSEEEDNAALYLISGLVITALAISLLIYVALLVASVFLILGVQRERHQFITPWMYMTVIALVLIIIDLIKGETEFNEALAIKLVVVAVQAGSWYPIFSLYRQMTKPQYTQQPENAPLNVGYVAYPQTMQGAYPSGAYAPQMQPAVYQPQMQPLYPSAVTSNYNPAPTACYPRQAMVAAPDDPPSYLEQTKNEALPPKS